MNAREYKCNGRSGPKWDLVELTKSGIRMTIKTLCFVVPQEKHNSWSDCSSTAYYTLCNIIEQILVLPGSFAKLVVYTPTIAKFLQGNETSSINPAEFIFSATQLIKSISLLPKGCNTVPDVASIQSNTVVTEFRSQQLLERCRLSDFASFSTSFLDAGRMTVFTSA